ncbi:hypothetical protein PIIN_09951 [Serendipita indica DSM 11827]|uniref:Uncharacterized protein n=1 Tax=Serendipita indica (strain DSM 11827) TaxID=1109443 RepID=G4TXB2_SERID|nr:hypothetical protein PIIN_09951 [Serendipita indica DSM 11827]
MEESLFEETWVVSSYLDSVLMPDKRHVGVPGASLDISVCTTNLSWIWQVRELGEQVNRGESWLEEVLRVQYLETKVNFDRWDEERSLVWAEFGFTKNSFHHMEHFWSMRAMQPEMQPGENAHAWSMVEYYSRLAAEMQACVDRFAHLERI